MSHRINPMQDIIPRKIASRTYSDSTRERVSQRRENFSKGKLSVLSHDRTVARRLS
jgi:hypothetical protein